jgi:hypothetical protein
MDDDLIDEIIADLRQFDGGRLHDQRPHSRRQLKFYQYVRQEVCQSISRARGENLKQIPPDELRKLAKQNRKIRHAIGVLKKELPLFAHLPRIEPPKGMHGENAAAYWCGDEAFYLLELICGEAPTSAEDGSPFRSITDHLLRAAGIEHDSRNICYAVLHARNRFPRNTPASVLPPLAPKIV